MSLLEPLMVVVLGGMVGTIVVAMFSARGAIESLQGGASSGDVDPLLTPRDPGGRRGPGTLRRGHAMTPNQTESRGRTAGTLRCSSAERRAGFTIIELLVTILVIAILIGVLIVAISAALRQSRRAGEQQTVSGIQVGIGVFQSTFDNRLPPLVYDGEPIALVSHASTPRIPGGPTSGPVERQGASDPVVATYERIYQDGGTAVLTGRVPPAAAGLARRSSMLCVIRVTASSRCRSS